MANLKQRLHKKNSSGTYDVIYLEVDLSNVVGILSTDHGGTGTNTITDVEAVDAPEQYVHPATKQCNYSYTHPTSKQCNYSYTHPATKQCDAAAGSHSQAASTITAGTLAGQVSAQNNTNYTTAQVRNIILSTADPSGGNNGDIWIKYTE